MNIFVIAILIVAGAFIIGLLVDRKILKGQLAKTGVQNIETLGKDAVKEAKTLGQEAVAEVKTLAKGAIKEAERLLPIPSLEEIEADLKNLQAKIARALDGQTADLNKATADAQATQAALAKLQSYQQAVNSLAPAPSGAPAPSPAPAGTGT
jgi:hypothetical protein